MNNQSLFSIKPLTPQQGFTILEALIAIVIVTIGLLGHLALLGTTSYNNRASYQRSQATLLAYDIVECMRANRARAGDYNIALDANPTGNTVAAQDLQRWRLNLSTALTQGKGSVSVASGIATITIQWADSRPGAANNKLSFTTSTRL